MAFYSGVLSTKLYEVVAISSSIDTIPFGTAVKVDELPTASTTPYSYFQVSKASSTDVILGVVAENLVTDTQFGRVILLNSGLIPVLMNETLFKGTQIKVTTIDGKFGESLLGDTPLAILTEDSTIGALAWAQIISAINPPSPKFVSVSGNYTVLKTDQIVLQTMAGSNVKLPTAVGDTNVYTITNGSNGNITLDTTLSQTISGILTITLFPMDSIDVYSDGTNYMIK